MTKYSVVDCYSCPHRQMVIYEVKNNLTNELSYHSESEWEVLRKVQFSDDELVAFNLKYKREAKALEETIDRKKKKKK